MAKRYTKRSSITAIGLDIDAVCQALLIGQVELAALVNTHQTRLSKLRNAKCEPSNVERLFWRMFAANPSQVEAWLAANKVLDNMSVESRQPSTDPLIERLDKIINLLTALQ